MGLPVFQKPQLVCLWFSLLSVFSYCKASGCSNPAGRPVNKQTQYTVHSILCTGCSQAAAQSLTVAVWNEVPTSSSTISPRSPLIGGWICSRCSGEKSGLSRNIRHRNRLWLSRFLRPSGEVGNPTMTCDSDHVRLKRGLLVSPACDVTVRSYMCGECCYNLW